METDFLPEKDRRTLALWFLRLIEGKTKDSVFRRLARRVEEIKSREWLNDDDIAKLAEKCYKEFMVVH